MPRITVVKELRRRHTQCAAYFFDCVQRYVFRRVSETRQRPHGDSKLFGESAVGLLTLRFPQFPLDGLRRTRFQGADLADMLFNILNKSVAS